MLKDELLAYLDQETQHFDWDHPSANFTANQISAVFQVKRNTVSHYLNQLVDEGKVIKINTRPVYFLSRRIFEQIIFPVSSTVFNGLQQLRESEPQRSGPDDLFANLIGADGSLRKSIEQIKTSIFYPDGGLPMMLNGPTGVGKSYTALLIHRYSIAVGVLPPDAPFISFNCAQYANNPELLSSNLFGYVKGAFTGADTTKKGMLEAANGGILFLDEVHRLNQEGQEKLFTFLDQGVFRRMGESEGGHHASVRLIFATTEDLEANFLETFLRRIPIRVMIPGLDERGEKEKKQFIYKFLIDEAQKLGMPLRVTSRALDSLTRYTYTGNLGELKNTIKYIAASAYSKNKLAAEVTITLHDLPDVVLEETKHQHEGKFRHLEDILITPHTTLEVLYESSMSRLAMIKKAYENILSLYQNALAKRFDSAVLEQSIFNEILALIDKLIFDSSDEHAGVMMEVTTVSVQEIIRYLENANSVKFNGNSVFAMAHFLYHKGQSDIRWTSDQESVMKKLAAYIEKHCKLEQRLVQQFVRLIESKLDAKLYLMDEIFLAFYLRSMAIERTNQQVKALIVAHGYATASSIANVANRLLNSNMYEAFDMPLDVSIDEIVTRVLNYIENNDVSKGLVILVDMGSLKEIDAQINKFLRGPVAIINNVSTQMALLVGDMLSKDLYVEDIVEKLQKANHTEYKIIYPEKEKERAILTTCLTGMGTAKQIQRLFEASIPDDMNVKVIAHDYDRLKKHGTEEAVFRMYDVLAVIGTADPGLEQIPYISLEGVISGQGEAQMRKAFRSMMPEERIGEINNNLVRNFSLERVIESITILDTNKILSHVEECLTKLEMLMNKRLTNDKKVALYVHVSCMVERLIRQAPIENYPNIEEFKQCQKEMIILIRKAFSVIEDIYNVKMNVAEIGYIYDYLVAPSSYHADF